MSENFRPLKILIKEFYLFANTFEKLWFIFFKYKFRDNIFMP